MPISERTLRKWRKEALKSIKVLENIPEGKQSTEIYERILDLTQELLDQHLLKK